MQNQVFLEENTNILNSIYHGDQTAESINEIAAAAKSIIDDQRKNNKKVFILINVKDIQGQTASARKAALDQLNFLDFDKLAIFGASAVIKQIVRFLMTLTTKGEKVKYFDTEKEARDWLLE